MEFRDAEIPDWFWAAIDAAEYRIDVLTAWLMVQPKEVVEAYGQAYLVAPWDLSEDGYDDELWVDGTQWSPDNVQDLCTWAVGQGNAFWQRIALRELSLTDAAEIYHDRAPGRMPWKLDAGSLRTRKSPWRIELGVYFDRFDGELLDILNSDEFMNNIPEVEPVSMPVIAE